MLRNRAISRAAQGPLRTNTPRMDDPPPDPGAWVYQERDAPGTNQCAGSDGILVPLTGGGSITFNPDRQNFVSYFNRGPNSQSAASTPRSESITAQQIGAMQNAIGTGFRIQLVRN